ncbi:MAG: fused MFS/spermidine synthase [Proteobacteria bacterium]|nr:fused MFS/spermidine synthase [Pseudomonadota bacterium]
MTLYAATITLSAFLLFLVQPIIARQILPWFGGSAAVWTTCMVFFQVTLLAGYAYSDLLIRKVTARNQVLIHGGLLLASLACLPIIPSGSFKPENADNPAGRILLLLTLTIGLPYLMLSTTGPLIQAWFTRRFPGGSVYRLYALSNAASMAALICYSVGWSSGYTLFAVMALATGWLSVRARDAESALMTADIDTTHVTEDTTDEAPPTTGQQLLWLMLAAAGSMLLLATTTHITQNVASIPFLWVLPLSIYLLTFIFCFDGSRWYRSRLFHPLAAVLATLMLAGLSFRPGDDWLPEVGLLHLEYAVPLYAIGLFVLCMFCHGELAARRPAPQHLTRFYLMLSMGGAVGGIVVGIVAPLALNWYWEFPAVLVVLSVLICIFAWPQRIMRYALLGLAAGSVWLAFSYQERIQEDTIVLTRNFYGTLRVQATAPDSDPDAKWRLSHGVITHGNQFRAPQLRRTLTTYYGEKSGIGQAILGLREGGMLAAQAQKSQRVGLIGLGVGTLSAYGREGDVYPVYELNPEVIDFALQHFTFLSGSRARIEVSQGDARLALEREPAQRFDVLAVDAFSSDSIPVHLITHQAIVAFARHVAPEGVIAYHISNRYLNLQPVVADLALSIGREAILIENEPGADQPWLYRTDWIVITGNRELADRLVKQGGQRMSVTPGFRGWTDDYNNLFSILK